MGCYRGQVLIRHFCKPEENMDHHEQHHLHHRKEREQHIQHEEERERRSEQQVRKIHPAWFVVLGSVLVVLIVLTWLWISSW
jgi:hypothetical protein